MKWAGTGAGALKCVRGGWGQHYRRGDLCWLRDLLGGCRWLWRLGLARVYLRNKGVNTQTDYSIKTITKTTKTTTETTTIVTTLMSTISSIQQTQKGDTPASKAIKRNAKRAQKKKLLKFCLIDETLYRNNHK